MCTSAVIRFALHADLHEIEIAHGCRPTKRKLWGEIETFLSTQST